MNESPRALNAIRCIEPQSWVNGNGTSMTGHMMLNAIAQRHHMHDDIPAKTRDMNESPRALNAMIWPVIWSLP